MVEGRRQVLNPRPVMHGLAQVDVPSRALRVIDADDGRLRVWRARPRATRLVANRPPRPWDTKIRGWRPAPTAAPLRAGTPFEDCVSRRWSASRHRYPRDTRRRPGPACSNAACRARSPRIQGGSPACAAALNASKATMMAGSFISELHFRYLLNLMRTAPNTGGSRTGSRPRTGSRTRGTGSRNRPPHKPLHPDRSRDKGGTPQSASKPAGGSTVAPGPSLSTCRCGLPDSRVHRNRVGSPARRMPVARTVLNAKGSASGWHPAVRTARLHECRRSPSP